MAPSNFPDDVRVERKVMMRNQVAQPSRRGAMRISEQHTRFVRQLLDGLANDLQIEQHGVEDGFFSNELFKVAP